MKKLWGWLRRILVRKNWPYITGVVIVCGLIVYGLTVKNVGNPQYCMSCHEIRADYFTWTQSSHSNVNCLTCHPGQKFLIFKEMIQHIGGWYQKPVKIKDDMADKACETCHTIKRQVTASGDLIIDHQKHIQRMKTYGSNCVICHSRVTHAGVSTNPDQAVQVAAAGNKFKADASDYRPKMANCMQCHNGKTAFYTCEGCHGKIATPSSHYDKNWGTKHGKEAEKEINYCMFCHYIALGKQPKEMTTDVPKAVRANEFCATKCHLNRPPSHNKDWPLGHAVVGRVSTAGCMVCHDQNKTEGSVTSGVIYCAQCHTANHPKTWRQDHPNVVKKEGFISCFKCHKATDCGDCHAKNNVKPNIQIQ